MMDADVKDMLAASLRHTLAESSDTPLSVRLDELGWADVLTDNEPAAVRMLFTIKGETVSSADALGPELARRLALATGDQNLAAALVALPTVSTVSESADGALMVSAVVGSRPGEQQDLVVIAGGLGAEHLLVIPAGGSRAVTPYAGIDPDLGLLCVTQSVSPANVRNIGGEAASVLLGAARALLATEMIGLAAHVIASAVEYTGQRVQYGKAIGTFQALQHRIASAHALITGATHLAEHAVDTGDAWTALVAKAMAGQAAEAACVQAQQCYGAIGFTWEHEFHHYLKRAYVLDWIGGDWRSLERQIGATLQATGIIPRIGSL
jgi:Acyl-CoA dehydrogenase, C-terminal domain